MGLPTRVKPNHYYVPWAQVIGALFQIIGVGIWVHYAMFCYNQSRAALDFLAEGIESPALDQTNSSVISASVVYLIFAVPIFVYHFWRSSVEMEQDRTGEFYHAHYLHYVANVALQGFWILVMVWILVVLQGTAAFASIIYAVRQPVMNAYIYQGLGGGTDPLIPKLQPPTEGVGLGSCPVQCVYIPNIPHTQTLNLNTVMCSCDTESIASAFQALDDANSNARSMLVGVWLMIVGGFMVSFSLFAIYGRIKAEADYSERLEEMNAKR